MSDLDKIHNRESVKRLDFNREQLAKLSKEKLLDFACGFWFLSSLQQARLSGEIIGAAVSLYKDLPHFNYAATTFEIIEDIQQKQQEWLRKRTEGN